MSEQQKSKRAQPPRMKRISTGCCRWCREFDGHWEETDTETAYTVEYIRSCALYVVDFDEWPPLESKCADWTPLPTWETPEDL